ncbi:MAG TPA: PAS domain S-box protein, partial [Desulfobaccales bacterium]
MSIMNATSRFLATVTEQDKGSTRNICNQEGYESVALVPFRQGDRILGLIHVADRRENLVPLEKVEILERAAIQLGTAFVRLQTEEALKDSEQFLTDVFNSIEDGLSITDRDLNVIRVNPAMEKFGYAGQIVGRKCYEAYQGQSTPCKVCPVQQTFRTGKASREIVTEDLADGSKRFMEIYAFPLQGRATGQVRGAIEFVRDVTERLGMEQALRDSEKKYHDLYNLTRLIVDNVPDLIWAKGTDDKFVLVNQAMCNKLLMIDRPDEALGKTDMLFAKKERLAGFEHTFGKTCANSDDVVKETKTPGRFLESGLIRGQKLVLDVYKAPLFNQDGQIIGTVGCGRDVTREQEIEEALRQSEEQYRLLVRQIPAVVFRGYGDWSVDFFDRKIEALSGYSKDDFDSRRVKGCDLIPAEDLDYAKRVFLKALKTDKSYVREHRLRRKSGELIWVQCCGQIFCDDSGKVDYTSGVFFDVTDR